MSQNDTIAILLSAYSHAIDCHALSLIAINYHIMNSSLIASCLQRPWSWRAGLCRGGARAAQASGFLLQKGRARFSAPAMQRGHKEPYRNFLPRLSKYLLITIFAMPSCKTWFSFLPG